MEQCADAAYEVVKVQINQLLIDFCLSNIKFAYSSPENYNSDLRINIKNRSHYSEQSAEDRQKAEKRIEHNIELFEKWQKV